MKLDMTDSGENLFVDGSVPTVAAVCAECGDKATSKNTVLARAWLNRHVIEEHGEKLDAMEASDG